MDTSPFDRRLADDPVAIVGMSGLFPKSADLGAFWDNIVAGRDCIEEVPSNWWDPDLYHDPDISAEDRTYARRGGFLSPTLFDPREFGMPPKSLDSIGLVQLLSLLVARDTLADAGNAREGWYDPARTGVILGVAGITTTLIPLVARLLAPTNTVIMRDLGFSPEDTQRFTRAYLSALPGWTADSFPGTLANVISGRIANRLNLGAANHTVDAACAGSLAAVRGAVDELLNGRADLMLTGGCDADNSIVSFMCFSKTPALSPGGRVRPFDRDADGTLVGEGVGMLALKRLDDAEHDGDRIYAVLRGLGSSSDGHTKSIYAPCGAGQLRALRNAYADADCPATTVGLIEAHGTGTATGDEVELNALHELLTIPGPANKVAVGSVKSQIGHTKAAAGAAGLIKAALALHHRILPPTANVDHPRAPADRADGSVYVNTVARPWLRDAARPVRRAGVSSFGFGGVNYHAVLEEHPGADRRPAAVLHRAPRAHLWHAPDPRALRDRLHRGDACDDGPVPADHARLGFVSTDDAHRDRLAALALAHLEHLAGGGDGPAPPEIHYRATAAGGAGTAALFSGQGSQYVDMGRSALLAVPPLRAVFDQTNALFPADDTLGHAVFPPPGGERSAEAALRRTDYAQPAIGALSRGHYTFLRELGFVPDAVLGHSFGELTALWAAGVLDDEAFPRLAVARGRALRPPAGLADPGAMAAVQSTEAELRALIAEHPHLVVCNHNAPDEHVVGGPTDEVGRFLRRCVDRGVVARPLAVAAAFHTPLVHHALQPFEQACRDTDFHPPRLPVHANTEGATYGPHAEANRRILVHQLRSPVHFAARLEAMYADGIRVFVEFGPQSILTHLARRTFAGREVETIACDLGAATDGAHSLKTAALRLAVLGLPVAGLNRHDRAPRLADPAVSSVARLLTGPRFAEEGCRNAYEACVAEASPSVSQPPPVEAPSPVPLLPTPARVPETVDPLTEAAASHLAAHTRFLDGQLATARELIELLRSRTVDGRVDESLAGAVSAIADHALALGRAHTRAGEVVTELLRDPAGERKKPAAREWSAPPKGAFDSGDEPGPPVPAASGRQPLPVPHGRTAPESDAEVPSPTAPTELPASEDPAEHAGSEGVSLEEITRTCYAIVADKTGYDVEMLEPDLYIQEDLGIDSLKLVEVGSELWRRYPSIKREELFRFTEARTIGELTGIFCETLAAPRSALRVRDSVPTGRSHVVLRTLPAVDVRPDAFGEHALALVVDDGGELPDVLAWALLAKGWRVERIALPGVSRGDGTESLSDWSEETLAARVAHVARVGAGRSGPAMCVLPVSPSSCASADDVVRRLRHAVLVAKLVATPLRDHAGEGESARAAFVTVTRLDGALGYAGSGGDPVAALAGGLVGLVKSVALEIFPVFCRALDYSPELPEHAVADAFLAEIADVATDVREVGWDGWRRRAPYLSTAPDTLLPASSETAHLCDEDLLLVTGGARGITAWCVSALARDHACGYVLLGRTPLPSGPAEFTDARDFDTLLAALTRHTRDELGAAVGDDELADRARQILTGRVIAATLEELRARGVEVEYLTADVRDAAEVARTVAPHAARITGVIHGAGVLRDRPLSEMDGASIAPVIDTKLFGLHHVLAALDVERLRHLVVFTSVAGIFGNVRQSDYALANEAVNRYACAFKAAHPRCRVTPLAWGPWEGGMAADVHRWFEEMGVTVLSRETGGAYFREQMGTDHADDGITVIGPTMPWFDVSTPLPAAGLAATRELAGLDREPMLRDHLIGGKPLLPMTAALGWALHTVERAQGATRSVTECRDFRINRGLYFDGAEPARLTLEVTPDPTGRCADVATRPDGVTRVEPSFGGSFDWSERTGPPPSVPLPPLPLSDDPHPAYAAGTLFHGPALAGLRTVAEEGNRRLVVTARLADPGLAHGAFAGSLFSPALADLLLQAGPLVWWPDEPNAFCAPVSVERVELFAPLPDDQPFVVISEGEELGALDGYCTVTACDTSGRVLQRWNRLRTLRISQADAVRMLTAPAHAPLADARA